MAELGAYYITIMPSMKGFTKAVNNQLGDLGTTGGKGFSSRFSDVLKGSAIGTALGNLAMKAGGAITSGLKTGIGRLDIIKNFPKVMEGLGYSTQDADKSIQMIMEHLDGLPTSTQDMVTLTQAISDSTGDLDLATKAALGFNDMMLANGASTAEMTTAQGVLNRILGKGSATVAQWQSLTSVMPAQLGQVARHMLGAGASTEDLHAALEDGTVSWNDFLRAVVELDEKGEGAMDSFYQQARNNSVGIGTALENIPNRIGAGWAKILEVIGQKEISSTIDKMSYGVRNAMYGIADTIDNLKQRLAESGAFDNLTKIVGLLSQGFQGFAGTISGAVNSAIPVIADLISKALQWIVDHGQQVGEFTGAIGKALGEVAGVISGALSAALPVATDLISSVLEWVINHGELAATLIKGIAAAMVFKGVVESVTGVVKSFSALTELTKDVHKLKDIPAMFKLVAEEGGPLAGIFSRLAGVSKSVIGGVSGMHGAFGTFKGAISGIPGALSSFGSTLAGIATGPVGIAVGAIAALVAVVKTLWDNNEGFRKAVTGIWDGIVAKVQAAGQQIGEALSVFKPALDSLGGFLGELGQTFGTYFGGLLAQLKELWNMLCNVLAPAIQATFQTLGQVIGGVVDVVTGVVQGIAGIIQGFKDGDWTLLTQGIANIWNGVWEVASAPVQAVFDTVGGLLEPFKGTWDTFCQDAQKDWSGFCDTVGREWESFKKTASDCFTGINTEIARNFNDAKTVGEATMGYFGAALKGDWEEAGRNAEKAFTTIDKSITDHLRAAKDSGIPIVSQLASGALEKWEWLKTEGVKKITDLASGISQNLETAKSTVLGIFDNIRNGISEKIQWAKEQVDNTIEGIKNLFNFDWSLPAPKLPHIDWHWEDVGGVVSFPVFDGISWYAKGGVFDTAAIIGIGEKGREAALPLNDKTYREIARGIDEQRGREMATVVVTGNTFVVREEADIDRIGRSIARNAERESEASLWAGRR